MKFRLLLHRAGLLGILVGCLLGCISCAEFKGNSKTGDWRARTLLTNVKDLDLSDKGVKASDINQSEAFLGMLDKLEKAFAKYMIYQGLTYSLGQYFNHEGAKLSSAQTIRLNEIRSAETIKEAELNLKELEMMMEAPATAPQ